MTEAAGVPVVTVDRVDPEILTFVPELPLDPVAVAVKLPPVSDIPVPAVTVLLAMLPAVMFKVRPDPAPVSRTILPPVRVTPVPDVTAAPELLTVIPDPEDQ